MTTSNYIRYMDLQTITIKTKTNAVYVFPDVDPFLLRHDIQHISSDSQNLTILNASTAFLIVPVRIIASVKIGEEEIWNKDS